MRVASDFRAHSLAPLDLDQHEVKHEMVQVKVL